MYFFFNTGVLLLVTFFLTVLGDFNPFMDNDLFRINWAGPQELNRDLDDNQVVVTTSNNEKYQCVLPDLTGKREDGKSSYSGLAADELVKQLFDQKSCSYRIESYWTYELCHGTHFRQYHETKEPGQKPKVQEYFLGYSPKTSTRSTDEESSKTGNENIKIRKIEGISLPYYEVNMTDGTACDLTAQSRKTRVLYVCQPEGHGEIYEFKETSTCEYEVMILTSVLCSHPDFRPKNPPVSQIKCHALDGSPKKPTQLEALEKETKSQQEEVQVNVKLSQASNSETFTQDVQTKVVQVQPDPPQSLGSTADKQLLREFLSGDYCLKGGTGWWKHEFCYGKYARQFHDDSEGRIVINLGNWNEHKHIEWLRAHHHKQPKPVGERTVLSLLYSDGDICEEIGQKRTTEVRIKCVTNSEHPHSVSLYLMEPSVCHYILGVESPIFCSLMDKADNHGIFRNIEI